MQGSLLLSWIETAEREYSKVGETIIDARQDLTKVVDEVLSAAGLMSA